MSWVKLDDGFPDHRKQLAAGAAACWLWACGLAYCNRQKTRDGFIPNAKVTLLYPLRDTSKLSTRLVEVGLWDRVEGGFKVHDYHDYQPSSDSDQAKKAESGRIGGLRSGETRRAIRDSKHEAKSKQSASSKTKPVPSRPDPVHEERENPPTPIEATEAASEVRMAAVPPEPLESEDDEPALKGEALYRSLYCRAVAVAKGSPYQWPDAPKDFKNQGVLNVALATFAVADGKALRGRDLVAWIDSHVRAFVRHVIRIGDKPGFWSSFGPPGFVKWLNEGAPGREAEAEQAQSQTRLAIPPAVDSAPDEPADPVKLAEFMATMAILEAAATPAYLRAIDESERSVGSGADVRWSAK